MTTKKRFIAGAVCPACKAMDRVQMYRDSDYDYRECVACGFHDKMLFKPVVRELGTRVNQEATKVEKETQVVTILPPK